jgi:hypothetical protein
VTRSALIATAIRRCPAARCDRMAVRLAPAMERQSARPRGADPADHRPD